MSEEPTALAVIEAATLPESYKVKAAKLLLRVIGGTFGHEILQAAQEGLDTTAGRTRVSMALADAIAKEAVGDPDQIERARVRFLGETYRKQENVEAVAKAAAEEIASEPADPTQEPEDDWLNVFARYAEDASSERSQRLWGQVLAGEYRVPGSVSLRTLRLLSELDQQTADDFEQVVGHVTGDFILFDESNRRGEPLLRLMRLETAGLLVLGGGTMTRTITQEEPTNLTLIVPGDPLSLAGRFVPNTSMAIPCVNLTVTGRELGQLIRKRLTSREALLRLANFLKGQGAQELVIGVVTARDRLNLMEVVHKQ